MSVTNDSLRVQIDALNAGRQADRREFLRELQAVSTALEARNGSNFAGGNSFRSLLTSGLLAGAIVLSGAYLLGRDMLADNIALAVSTANIEAAERINLALEKLNHADARLEVSLAAISTAEQTHLDGHLNSQDLTELRTSNQRLLSAIIGDEEIGQSGLVDMIASLNQQAAALNAELGEARSQRKALLESSEASSASIAENTQSVRMVMGALGVKASQDGSIQLMNVQSEIDKLAMGDIDLIGKLESQRAEIAQLQNALRDLSDTQVATE